LANRLEGGGRLFVRQEERINQFGTMADAPTLTEPVQAAVDPVVTTRDDPSEQTKVLTRRSTAPSGPRSASFDDIVAAVKDDPLYQPAHDLFMWHDPVRSGLLLGISVLALVLLTWGGYSLVTLSSYVFLFTAAISFALVQYSNVSGQPHLFKSRLGSVQDFISKEQSSKHAESAHRIADALSLMARDALLFQDVPFSLKFIFVAILAAVLFHFVPPVALVGVPFILSFALFKIYSLKQAEIDGVKARIDALYAEKVAPIVAKIPFDKVQLKEKTD